MLSHTEMTSEQMALLSLPTKKFWGTVQPGEKFGFFDNDQCLFGARVDVEQIALEEFGLVESVKDWKATLAQNNAIREEAVLVDERAFNLSSYPRTVTEQLAEHTKVKIGTPLTAEVVKLLGRAVGRYTLENGLMRPVADDVLRECNSQGIRSIIISATPIDLVQGVLEVYQEQIGLPIDTVLGTADRYHPDGRVTETLLFFGQPKTLVVQETKRRGGIAIIGAGDKPDTSDAFVNECQIQGRIINRTPDRGNLEWQRVHQRLVALRS